MMSETEAYLQLVMMVGILFCLPFLVTRVVPRISNFITAHFFPMRYIDVEVTENGETYTKRVSLEEDAELLNALLNIRDLGGATEKGTSNE